MLSFWFSSENSDECVCATAHINVTASTDYIYQTENIPRRGTALGVVRLSRAIDKSIETQFYYTQSWEHIRKQLHTLTVCRTAYAMRASVQSEPMTMFTFDSSKHFPSHSLAADTMLSCAYTDTYHVLPDSDLRIDSFPHAAVYELEIKSIQSIDIESIFGNWNDWWIMYFLAAFIMDEVSCPRFNADNRTSSDISSSSKLNLWREKTHKEWKKRRE